MKGNFFHPVPKIFHCFFYLSLAGIAFCLAWRLLPRAFVPHSSETAPLFFEKPDFSQNIEAPEQAFPDNPGYQIEYTSRGAILFRTEPAGSPAFGTPIPEMLPYEP